MSQRLREIEMPALSYRLGHRTPLRIAFDRDSNNHGDVCGRRLEQRSRLERIVGFRMGVFRGR